MTTINRTATTGGIEATGLAKRYGDFTALDDLDLEVSAGSVLALLGPNGAGKTTTVSILTTLIRPDAGTATVAGADLISSPHRVRERIGVSGQYAAVDEALTGFENLDMIGRLYHLGRRRAATRADELLERFSLTDAARRQVKTYSGGMRRRLDLAGALVAEPPVLFLDEPTTGLDPRSRSELWDAIRDLVDRGTTVLLTTQYMEEADLLADDIAVLDGGRMIARGTTDELKATVGGQQIELTVDGDVGRALPVVARCSNGEPKVLGRTIRAPIDDPAAFSAAVRALERHGIVAREIGMRRPTLDDVFLALTGRPAGAGSEPGPVADHRPTLRAVAS